MEACRNFPPNTKAFTKEDTSSFNGKVIKRGTQVRVLICNGDKAFIQSVDQKGNVIIGKISSCAIEK